MLGQNVYGMYGTTAEGLGPLQMLNSSGLERDQQLTTTLFIYRPLYQNLKVTANQKLTIDKHKKEKVDFPRGPVVKNSPANAGDMVLIPGLGRFCILQGN